MSIDGSPQHLIQSFLRANLPELPSFSVENDSVFDPSADFGEYVERDDSSSDISMEGIGSGKQLKHESLFESKEKYEELITELKISCYELKKSLQLTQHKLTSSELERDHLKSLLSSTKNNLELEICSLQEKCQKMSTIVESQKATLYENEKKLQIYAQNETEWEALRVKVISLESLNTSLQKSYETLQTSGSQSKIDLESALLARDMFEKDKRFLIEEVARLETLNRNYSLSLEAERSKSVSLEAKVLDLQNELNKLQIYKDKEWNEKFEKETLRLKEDSRKEMEYLKDATVSLTEREIRSLNDAKVVLEAELNVARTKNQNLSDELLQVQRAFARYQSTKTAEILDVQSELKMKAFEATNLGISLEEKIKLCTHLQGNCERFEKETSILKNTIALMESEHKRELATVETSLSTALSKLSAYEALEVEIDQTVLRIAGASASNSRELQVELLKGIPTCPERRVRQAMHLAQRLLQTEQAKEKLESQHQCLKKDYDQAVAELQSLQLSLSHASKPTNYLVTKLREEETEKLRVLENNKKLRRELNVYKKRFISCRSDFNDLQDRLEIILRQKGEIETVKTMLTHLQELNSDDDSGTESDSEQEDNLRNDSTPIQEKQTSVEVAVPAKESSFDPIAQMALKLGLTPQIVQQMIHHPNQKLK